MQVSDASSDDLPIKKLEKISEKTLDASGDPSKILKIAYITHHPDGYVAATMLDAMMTKHLENREEIGSATFTKFILPSGPGKIDPEQIKEILKEYHLVMFEGNLGHKGDGEFPYKKDWFKERIANAIFFDGSGKYARVNQGIEELELGEHLLLSKNGSYTHLKLAHAFNPKKEDAWSIILAGSARFFEKPEDR